jgi:hypothetical protein
VRAGGEGGGVCLGLFGGAVSESGRSGGAALGRLLVAGGVGGEWGGGGSWGGGGGWRGGRGGGGLAVAGSGGGWGRRRVGRGGSGSRSGGVWGGGEWGRCVGVWGWVGGEGWGGEG